jgi:hypothetical protein
MHPRVRLKRSLGPRTDCAGSGTCAPFAVRQRRFLSQLPPASTRGAALFFRRGARPDLAPCGLPEGRRHAAGGAIVKAICAPGGRVAWNRAEWALQRPNFRARQGTPARAESAPQPGFFCFLEKPYCGF